MNKITKAVITPMPKDIFDPMPKVIATFDNGETKELFSFYPDEISFSESEFIGLTENEAHNLFHRKDVEYIRS